MSDDFAFFRTAVLHITGSLDLSVSMVSTFQYLKMYFPLSAISLHQYSRERRELKLLFLVTDAGFSHVEKMVPIPDKEGIHLLNRQEDIPHIFIEADTSVPAEAPVAFYHGRGISDLLPLRPRSYLSGMLTLGNEVIGHVVFIGPSPHCFTEEHRRLLDMLLPPFSLAMANMLKFKRTMEFQARLDEEKRQLAEENRLLRSSPMIGSRSGLKEIFVAVRQLAGRDTPVLIRGETGTGKELLVEAIREVSARSGGPFVKVNCGAIPDSLIDSELFGFEKGAFTGAHSSRAGFFEQADGGTLFLDEIGELSMHAQVRLLRVLQSGEIQRLGGSQPRPVDVRIIAATNRNLENMLQHNLFREDLYYRLNVFPITIPPLRDRKEDIPLLLRHFLDKSAKRLGVEPPELDLSSLYRLLAYSWQVNIRELENLVERALVLNPPP